jgi:predicted alpha-1,6-mannanase (GH76 family)
VLLGEVRRDPLVSCKLGRQLERYRRGAAYSGARRPGISWRFYDDNAWVGLAAAQAVQLGAGPEVGRLAERLLAWIRAGEHPEGGVRWRERRSGRHACSTGSAGMLALRVAPPGQTCDPDVVEFARRCRAFLSGALGRSDGLVADNVDSSGRVGPTAFSYNQGLAIGLDVLLHAAGDTEAVDRARRLAGATLDHFAALDGLWRQPPAFNAVLLRSLLLLHSADADSRWTDAVDHYLDRAWSEARNRSTGLFTEGGIGSYGTEQLLDQAAFVQLAALRAWPTERLASIC